MPARAIAAAGLVFGLLLAPASRLRLTLDVEAIDPAGNRSRATRRVTVR